MLCLFFLSFWNFSIFSICDGKRCQNSEKDEGQNTQQAGTDSPGARDSGNDFVRFSVPFLEGLISDISAACNYPTRGQYYETKNYSFT